MDTRREVELAMRGDHDAFASLAAASADRLFALARMILRDTDRAEDATQEALVRAWRDLPRLRDPDKFDAWMRRLLVNACYDDARKAGRRREVVRMLGVDRRSLGELIAGDDAVWVTRRTDIVRLDPETLEPAPIAALPGYPAGLVRDGDHAWIL